MKNKCTFHIAKSFNKTDRYIDDLISADNKRFKEYVPHIYPKEFILKQTNQNDKEAEYLDLSIKIKDDGNIDT